MFKRQIFNAIRWMLLFIGLLLLAWAAAIDSISGKGFLLVLAVLFLTLSGVMVWWYIRPNRAHIRHNPELQMETWDVANDLLHNSNTDMILVDGVFYMVHAVSPFHFADTGCHLVLKKSLDGHTWESLAQFMSPGEDIRDPKLAWINGRLLLYALVNRSIDPEPYATVVCWSQDGCKTWSPFQKIEHEGWLLWKPKTRDGMTWYAAAYWWEHGKSVLFKTYDGIHLEKVADIHQGNDRNDETDIEFLPDGRMIATARIEGSFKETDLEVITGHTGGCTKIFTAEPPFTKFSQTTASHVTRLDGPALFRYNQRIYAVGRFQPEINNFLMKQGSALARKRTAIFEVKENELVWLSNVPSAGDTSYAGVALKGEDLYFVYYTSAIHHDYPWIIGMFNPTAIRMACIPMSKFEKLVDKS
jgi:hypothetical protein